MSRQTGLTLVEVLVAMLLVLVVVAGAIAFVTRGRAAHRTSESLAQLEESLDAAFALLVDEVRLAGYLGLAPPATSVAGASVIGGAERPTNWHFISCSGYHPSPIVPGGVSYLMPCSRAPYPRHPPYR